MSGRITLALVFFLFFASCSSAFWVAFEEAANAASPVRTSMSVLKDGLIIDIQLPGIELTEEDGFTVINIPGQGKIMRRGEPELPVITMSLALPDTGRISLELLDTKSTDIRLKHPPVPSRGHLTRNIRPADVPRMAGPVYKSDKPYPTTGFSVNAGKPYIVRDLRGSRISLVPFIYHPSSKMLSVLRRAAIRVTFLPQAGKNEKLENRDILDRAFFPVYKSHFINFAVVRKSKSSPGAPGRALIICPDRFADAMQPLHEWRLLKGMESELVKVSRVLQETASDHLTGAVLKQYIQSQYSAGRLVHVLLVGDYDTMPTLRGDNEGAFSDASLVMCEGDDHIPDVFIGRFSAKTVEQVRIQVNRTMAYEKNPKSGYQASFYRRAIGVASDEGDPKDRERADLLRRALLDYHFDDVARIYDPNASAMSFRRRMEEGCSIVNYIGHGTEYAWATTWLDTFDIPKINNTDGKWPMIWSVACLNGHFAYGADCFCEAWAKAGTPDKPRGAIGIVGSSTNMAWVPPCVWQKAIIDYGVTGEQAFCAGALHLLGLLKACEEYGFDVNDPGIQLVEQCIFFGDASVILRNDKPSTPSIEVVGQNDNVLVIRVSAGGRPVNSALVVLRTAEHGQATALSSENGEARLRLPSGLCLTTGHDEPMITVTGPNLLPLIEAPLKLRLTH